MKPWIKSLSRHGAEALGIMLILLGVYTYQSRNLLPAEIQPAPELSAPTLEGAFYDLREHAAPATLVYFFAPWCHVCAARRRARVTSNTSGIYAVIMNCAYSWWPSTGRHVPKYRNIQTVMKLRFPSCWVMQVLRATGVSMRFQRTTYSMGITGSFAGIWDTAHWPACGGAAR